MRRPLFLTAEMEMKKLHLGTMSYGVDSMDEVAHQLATALGEKPAQGTLFSPDDRSMS